MGGVRLAPSGERIARRRAVGDWEHGVAVRSEHGKELLQRLAKACSAVGAVSGAGPHDAGMDGDLRHVEQGRRRGPADRALDPIALSRGRSGSATCEVVEIRARLDDGVALFTLRADEDVARQRRREGRQHVVRRTHVEFRGDVAVGQFFLSVDRKPGDEPLRQRAGFWDVVGGHGLLLCFVGASGAGAPELHPGGVGGGEGAALVLDTALTGDGAEHGAIDCGAEQRALDGGAHALDVASVFAG